MARGGPAIGHFQKYHNTLCLPSKILHKHCSIFSWDLQWFQEKIKTMLMHNFGGQTKSIMVFLKVAYTFNETRVIQCPCSSWIAYVNCSFRFNLKQQETQLSSLLSIQLSACSLGLPQLTPMLSVLLHSPGAILADFPTMWHFLVSLELELLN